MQPHLWNFIKRTLTGAAAFATRVTGNSSLAKAMMFDAARSQFMIADGRETYIVSAKDKTIGRALYSRHEFEFEKIEKAFALAGLNQSKDDLLLLDVGANVGSVCIPVTKRKLATQAIAIEPEPLNVKLLRANIILNDMDDKIEVHPVALGEKEGHVEFELSESNFGDHRIRNAQSNGEDAFGERARKTISVNMTTLDSVMATKRSENVLLWMDTQGYEGFVLSGAQQFLARRAPLVLEFWPYGMKRNGSFEVLAKTLCDAPHQVFIDLSDANSKKRQLDPENLQTLFSELDNQDDATDILVL